MSRKPRDAVQFRCPDCHGEINILNVVAFSAGGMKCVHCGNESRRMSVHDYRAALNAAARSKKVK